MVTTIQINENVKHALDRMKMGKETYEETLIRMMDYLEKQKRKQEELMIEGCKEMAEDNIKISKEFELIENPKDWEWWM